MHALRALLTLLAFLSSAVLVNGLPTLSTKDATTLDISVEPRELSISSLRELNHNKNHATITSVDQEQGHDPNALTLQQPVNTLSELLFNSKHGPLEYTSVVDTPTVVLDGLLFQTQGHGLVHTHGREDFSTNVGPLEYTGNLDTKTQVLDVKIYFRVPFAGRQFLAHASGNLTDRVIVRFDKGALVTGTVDFYERGSSRREMWAKSNFVLFGKKYDFDTLVMKIPEDVIAEIPLSQAQDIGSVHKLQEQSFNEIIDDLKYTDTLDPETLALTVNKGRTIPGHENGDLDERVEFRFREEGTEGRVLFYPKNGAMWAESRVIVGRQSYHNDVEVLDIYGAAKVPQNDNKQHPISTLDITSFDAIVAPLLYTGIYDTETHTLGIDVDVLGVPDNIHLGTEEGPLRHSGGVLVEFDRPKVATGEVLFYEKYGKIWAMAEFNLYGNLYSSNVPVWDIPQLAQVQPGPSKQHSIYTLGTTPFNAIIGPLQCTGSFDTEAHILRVDIDVLNSTGEKTSLGHGEGILRGTGVYVEFESRGIGNGMVRFYERNDGRVWAMARFTLYGEAYSFKVPVWKIPA